MNTDSGHTWGYKEDFNKATKDLEASRKYVKALEQKLAEAENKFKREEGYIQSLQVSQGLAKKKADELEQKLSEALEVIRFYGDVDNWTDVSANICSSMTGGDDHGVLQPFKDRFCGGQRARRFLEKHGLEKV